MMKLGLKRFTPWQSCYPKQKYNFIVTTPITTLAKVNDSLYAPQKAFSVKNKVLQFPVWGTLQNHALYNDQKTFWTTILPVIDTPPYQNEL